MASFPIWGVSQGLGYYLFLSWVTSVSVLGTTCKVALKERFLGCAFHFLPGHDNKAPDLLSTQGRRSSWSQKVLAKLSKLHNTLKGIKAALSQELHPAVRILENHFLAMGTWGTFVVGKKKNREGSLGRSSNNC